MSRPVAAPAPREKTPEQALKEAAIARQRADRAAIRSMGKQPGWQVMKREALQELFRTIEGVGEAEPSLASLALAIGGCKKLVAILRVYELDNQPGLDTMTTKAGQSAPGGR